MIKVKITLSYDGSKFNGFQIQKNNKKLTTVAGLITKVFKKLNIQTNLVGSGRTDAGVHATAQVLHCELPDFWEDLEKLKIKINKMLAPSIYIKSITNVNEDFHARYGAYKRLYRYVLYSGEYQPFFAPYALHVKDINTKKLNSILKSFIGTHDFENFKKTGSDTKTDIRHIFKAGAYTYKNMTIIYFLGNSFIRSQVRMMSDFALKVMNEELTIEQLEEQLNKTQKHSTAIIPSCGLYLAKIFY
ncbi:tRNA pseudouridine(38-40) synthase TruA [Sulfurospirillum arcachonense]|uniref:tRNA pseudouridine(38-40) synthase TruA n=1 Tax=Sulfurospirillum arcachonense TaxID=57666 RepID=UPI0004B64819|nr:tRNA pseudouridine(38-40) synthase TruA [Sulfurospirillum arcachonense]